GSLRRRGIFGTIGTAAGLAVMSFGLFANTGGRAPLVGVGIALTFIGIAVLAPIVARPIAGLIGRPLPILSRGLIRHRDRSAMSGTLARNNAMRNPRRTSATAAALMIGLALVTMFSVFAESAKASVGKTLDHDFSIDYVVGTTNGFRPFSPTVEQKIAAVPGVGATSPLRAAPARYGTQSLTIDGVNAATVGRVIRFDFTSGNVTALAAGQLLVEDGAAKTKHWKVGQPVRITFPKTGSQTLTVGGTFKKNQFVDNYMVSTNVYEANFDTQLDQAVLIKAAPGVDPTSIRPGIERAVVDLPNLSVQDSASVKAQYRKQVNQLLGIIYALLGLSVIIAVIGIINTLVLSVTERTRELGLLRAVGMVRKQVKSMIRGELVVIALFGALLGLGLGTGFGVALTKATQSSGIGATLAIPISSLVVFVIFAAAVGVLAAMWPARRAARLNVLDSLAFE
ncbi:MAG TPA: FtsX-like permease family protein, partial [Acidimicrobiales bacterium]|nr:FtsX-like permease family protein [Acidimicrobiales bacterium]